MRKRVIEGIIEKARKGRCNNVTGLNTAQGAQCAGQRGVLRLDQRRKPCRAMRARLGPSKRLMNGVLDGS